MTDAEEMRALRESVSRIEMAIIGDKQLGNDGLVSKVRDHERRLRLLERIVLIGTGVGMVVTFLYSVYKDFHPHVPTA